MNIPTLDPREKKDILNEIKKLAKQYTPEWTFNENDPDFGVIFSKIFSDMFFDTINHFNKMPYYQYISFLNVLGAKLLPPISSTGMVTVDLVDGAEGLYIKKDSPVYASSDNEKGRIIYKTTNSMYAVSQKIKNVILTDIKHNLIANIYDNNVSDDFSFKLFDAQEKENLQNHSIYFENELLFYTKDNVDLKFYFKNNQSEINNKRLPFVFSDSNNIKWQYYKNEKWNDVSEIKNEKDGVRVNFPSNIDICNISGKKSRFLRCNFFRIPKRSLQLTSICCNASKEDLSPDMLLYNEDQLSLNNCFPFGEQFSEYTDFYILCDEAFSKKNAKIVLNINMKFMKVEMNKVQIPDTTKYKFVMTELDFKKPGPDDIVIDVVDFEYYNGIGWSKLFENNENRDFFKPDKDGNIKNNINFICPSDIQPVLIGPQNGYFIRARIKKASNLFTLKGEYISPYIKDIKINYDYFNNPVDINDILVKSNLEEKRISFVDSSLKLILESKLEKHPTMYMCLEKPIKRGPVRVFVDLRRSIKKENNPSLIWQYYSKDYQGMCSWKNLELMDLTKNFETSEIITFMGESDFVKTSLFGSTGYFIRVINIDNKYDVLDKLENHPFINGMYFNTVGVIQVEDVIPEYFWINVGDENKICKLSYDNLIDVDVYVEENGFISSNEQKDLIKNKDTIVEYNSDGTINKIWVKWHKVKNICLADSNERAFEVNYSNGKVIFGDGIKGRIPCSQKHQSIKIKYSISEGKNGNIKEGEIVGFSEINSYIKNVSNLKSINGGINKETIDICSNRVSKKLSGFGRIVSLEDFEENLKYNDRNVKKIKCVSHINRFGDSEPGVVSIAILPKNYMQGYEKFSAIKKRVKSFVSSKASLNLALSNNIKVFEVDYIKFKIILDIEIKDHDSYQQVYQDIYNRLKVFLNPIEGNFDKNGWEIGVLPKKEHIYNYIKSIKNIKRIKSLYMFTKIVTENGEKDMDESKINDKIFAVPIFTEPDINLSVD